MKKTRNLIEELGTWAARTFVEDLVSILDAKVNRESLTLFASSRYSKRVLLDQLRMLSDYLRATYPTCAGGICDQTDISDKALCLIDHFREVFKSQGPSFVGIIFVRRRVVAAMLQKLLTTHADVPDGVRSGVFVGESNSASFEKEVCELVVPRTQRETLHEFRTGRKNLIVSTDALDEGIDVAACNTIICFDPPQNLRSFIQKRGRARKEKSTYSIMVPRESSDLRPEDFEREENLMSEMLRRDRREAVIASQLEATEEEVNYCLRSRNGEYETECVYGYCWLTHLVRACLRTRPWDICTITVTSFRDSCTPNKDPCFPARKTQTNGSLQKYACPCQFHYSLAMREVKKNTGLNELQ